MRQELRTARASLASAEANLRREPTSDQRRSHVDALRSEYRTLALEDRIREVLDTAPPLSPEQRERLAGLFSHPGAEAAPAR